MRKEMLLKDSLGLMDVVCYCCCLLLYYKEGEEVDRKVGILWVHSVMALYRQWES